MTVGRRVLVTGATTPLGEQVVRVLLDAPDIDCVLMVGIEPAPRGLDPEIYDRLEYVRADLTRERHIRRLLYGPARDHAIDTIVHMAQHRRARDGGSRVHRLNVESTRSLLVLSESHPTIRSLIFRSHADVYRIRADRATVITEEHPLELSPQAPQWVRDRVEADVTVCTRMGLSKRRFIVLRVAECIAPHPGSQLVDYLGSRHCLRPMGYDPMINLISELDVGAAVTAAVEGVFNIPGLYTLPLSEMVARAGCRSVSLPGAVLKPIYRLRSALTGADFRYDQNQWRFHFSGVIDGRRAREKLGYVPKHGVVWTNNGAASFDTIAPR